MSKNNNKIKVLFCGENSYDVTGSQVYIETPNKKILIECGMYQSVGSTLENWKQNSKKFKFKPKELDAVFVQHVHIDHIGLIPLLYNRGYNGKIISPQNSKGLASILLYDSCHIIKSDADSLSNQFGKQYEPYYKENDVDSSLMNWEECSVGQIHEIDEFVKFRYVPSGHIVSSCQLELWLTYNNITKKILYTSDLGNLHIQKPYVLPFQPVTKCDIAICESTYAHEIKIADKNMRNRDIEKLKCVIKQTCIDQCGRILFPSFALSRTQEIMTILYDLYHDDNTFKIPIYIDSPMAIKICWQYLDILDEESKKKWDDILNWHNIKYISDPMESKEIRKKDEACIVVASSGFMLAGRSVAWCSTIIPKEIDRIVTIGYAPPGSMAYTIKQAKQKTISVSGKKCPNRCQITQLGSFTSHIQRDSMIKYYGSIDAEKVYLVHGDMDGKVSIKQEIQEEISRNNLTSKVIVVNKDMEVSI